VLAYPVTEYDRAALHLTEAVDYAECPPETLLDVVVGR
jgi:hypothetical protein